MTQSVTGTSTWMGFFFFFQAEDGIRDIGVTGVQTCALPIFTVEGLPRLVGSMLLARTANTMVSLALVLFALERYLSPIRQLAASVELRSKAHLRSEERRVGKECRSGGSPYQSRRKKT